MKDGKGKRKIEKNMHNDKEKKFKKVMRILTYIAVEVLILNIFFIIEVIGNAMEIYVEFQILVTVLAQMLIVVIFIVDMIKK